MKRIFLPVVVITIVAISALLGPLVAAAPEGSNEKIAIAQNFLHAYLLRDKDIVPYVPLKAENQFGPYPFKGPLQISTPKVDGNQAVLEFTANVTDAKLPQRAAVLFYNHDYKWHIRQVLFYDQVPGIFGLPTKSTTAQDKGFEQEVKAMGIGFLDAWERGDREKMLAHWFDWPRSEREPTKGLSMSHLKMTCQQTTWGDPFVSYSVKLTYRWGIFSYSKTVRGGLILVDENGNWKVRGNQMIFDF